MDIAVKDTCGDAVYDSDVVVSFGGGSEWTSLGAGQFDIRYWNSVSGSAIANPLFVEINTQAIEDLDVPFPILITPDDISAGHCTWRKAPPQPNTNHEFTAGVAVDYQILAFDQFDNPVTTASTNFYAHFRTEEATPFTASAPTSANIYDFSISSLTATPDSSIYFRYAGTDVALSPETPVEIKPDLPANAARTRGTIAGQGFNTLVSSQVNTFTVKATDQYGNTITD
jgi:hypothetical protein